MAKFRTKVRHTDRRTVCFQYTTPNPQPQPPTPLKYVTEWGRGGGIKSLIKGEGREGGHTALLGSCRSSLTLTFWVAYEMQSLQNPGGP